MPIIKARPADEKETERVILRLSKRHATILTTYVTACVPSEDPSYVVGQLIETVLAKDKDYVEYQKTSDHRTPLLGRRHDLPAGRTA